MNSDPAELDARSVALQNALLNSAGAELPPPLVAAVLGLARDARQAGRIGFVRPLLEQLVGLTPQQAEAWQLLGFGYAEEQRMPDAVRAFSRAAALAPDDRLTSVAHAQASLDAGLPAAALFAHAMTRAPGDLAVLNGRAAALAAEGEPDAADELLAQTLLQHPGWLQGHKQLAALRWTSGDSRQFARSYAAACDAEPRNLALRLAWFSALAQAHDWEGALKVVADGETRIGESPAFAAARAFVAGESDDRANAGQWFERTAHLRDDVLCMAHLRHCLRTAQVDQAERLALRLLEGPSAPLAWPYLSVIWRLRGDPHAEWLDGAPPYLRVFDLPFEDGELAALASVLRRLNTARSPHLEQSVRGGTQTDTDRQLLSRAEPEIQSARALIHEAIREYVAGMPAPLQGHPLLGIPRGRTLLSGSWSVRLTARGHHVSHTHPRGWISSALYVSLPEPADLGPAPAGWIRFGVPPATLGLQLPGYGQFEPKPGRLILFPSTMWHETLPFEAGERLVIAFDVARPRP